MLPVLGGDIVLARAVMVPDVLTDGHTDRRLLGLNNIELITDRPLEVNLQEIKKVKREWPDRAMIVITHYQRLLDHIVPDVVHVLSKGRIVKTGGKELALELEAQGYAQFQDDAA